MTPVTIRVSRFDPASGQPARLVPYTVEVHEGARVLHALHAAREQDPSLAYRYCCGSGQCGSCAVKVNGKPALACMTPVGDGDVIEPLDLPVVRDLVVDLVPRIARIAALLPKGGGELPDAATVEALKPLCDCVECGSCVSVCPAVAVTDFAGPTAMRQLERLVLDPRDAGDRVSQADAEGLFTCTSCHACYEACPKDIEIMGKAIERLRAEAHRRGYTFPRHAEIADLVRTTGRSVARITTPLFERVEPVIEPYGPVRGEVAFFVGCMYSMRLPETALDAIEVLRRNGIRVVIPMEQVCCGSPLLRTGQTEDLERLKRINIGAFRPYPVVMTTCAGCGMTLKKNYGDLPFRVMDINEVLTEFGIEPPARLPLKVTYHDPCHLLRGQGISEEPRAFIRGVADLVEMPAYCCGSGGGVKSGKPEEAAALGELRRKAIEETGADQVISSCPFCEFHIQGHTDLPVRNVASLLLDGYRAREGDARPGERKVQ
ncbi:MAG: succinate dehydrogenase/fumarate reductase iron-sulfur subunit [Methanospirillum sp.]|nr:succinate dehydrogenase/fumarate reductase iron-sulfur subunit [Methanospirillum sp.]